MSKKRPIKKADEKFQARIDELTADLQKLQAEFVEDVINHLYGDAVREQNLRVVDNPQVSLKKFVPYTTLEFEAEVEVLGPVKLADYKKIKKAAKKVEVSAKDVEAVNQYAAVM